MDANFKWAIGGLLLLANSIVARLDAIWKQNDANHAETMAILNEIRTMDRDKEIVP